MRAPIGLPSLLLIYRKKSGDVELWLPLVQRPQIVLHSLIPVCLLLVDETHVPIDGGGLVFHLGGTLQLSERCVVLAGKVRVEPSRRLTMKDSGSS